jgi:hypothetical protein
MMRALLKRDILLFALRGTEGFTIILLYLMGVFLLNFHGYGLQSTLVHALFLMFFILSQSLGNVLRDEYRYGFLDMIQVRDSNFLPFLWSKILVWWGFAGGALSLLSVGFLWGHGYPVFHGFLIFMSLSLMIILVTIMIGCLTLGARSFKGGIFILAMPIYVPPFLFALWALDSNCTACIGHIFLGGVGMILFYVPLCLALSNKALKEALEYK